MDISDVRLPGAEGVMQAGSMSTRIGNNLTAALNIKHKRRMKRIPCGWRP